MLAVVLTLLVALSAVPASGREQMMGDPADIAAEMQAELGLSDEQTAQTKAALERFAASIEAAHSAQEDAEEPDGQAMAVAIKSAKSEFREELKGILSPEQFQQFEVMVDEIMDEIFNTVAEIKLLDMQQPLQLSDDQMAQLVPIVGGSIRSVISLVMDAAGKRMGIRQKLQLARSMKKIKVDTDAKMSAVLTPQQQQQLQAYRQQRSG
jgi:Spy/CpxP family protein refolding chaperone